MVQVDLHVLLACGNLLHLLFFLRELGAKLSDCRFLLSLRLLGVLLEFAPPLVKLLLDQLHLV